MPTNIVINQVDLKKLRKITFILIYVLVAFAFLVMGEGLFEEWNQNWTLTTIIYLLGVSLFLGVQENLPRDLEAPLDKHFLGGSLCFLLATAVFILIHNAGWYFNDVTSMPVAKIPANFLFQLVIVCSAEEIIFRGIFYRYLRIYFKWHIPVFVTALVFALFHFVAYQGNIGALFIAFIMGVLLALCVERWNLGVSIGLHFAWNCFVLGITVLI